MGSAELETPSEASDTVVVPIQLPDGRFLHVEARRLGGATARPLPTESEASGTAFVSSEKDVAFFSEKDVAFKIPTMSEALAGVEDLAKEIAQVFQRVAPTSASVEFEVELAVASGQLTGLLVKGDSKASFKITLTWNKGAGAG